MVASSSYYYSFSSFCLFFLLFFLLLLSLLFLSLSSCLFAVVPLVGGGGVRFGPLWGVGSQNWVQRGSKKGWMPWGVLKLEREEFRRIFEENGGSGGGIFTPLRVGGPPTPQAFLANSNIYTKKQAKTLFFSVFLHCVPSKTP